LDQFPATTCMRSQSTYSLDSQTDGRLTGHVRNRLNYRGTERNRRTPERIRDAAWRQHIISTPT
jgi:hypothetical protein